MNLFHLGDRWARLNLALRLLEAGESFALCLSDRTAREIMSLLNVGSLRPRIIYRPPKASFSCPLLTEYINGGANAYRVHYFPTLRRPRLKEGTIGLALDANWKRDQKIPPLMAEAIQKLKAALPLYNFRLLGIPHQRSIAEVVRILCKLELVVSVDNGIAHIARSVGVPLFLIEHELSLTRGFPFEFCRYQKVSAADLPEKVLAYTESGKENDTEH